MFGLHRKSPGKWWRQEHTGGTLCIYCLWFVLLSKLYSFQFFVQSLFIVFNHAETWDVTANKLLQRHVQGQKNYHGVLTVHRMCIWTYWIGLESFSDVNKLFMVYIFKFIITFITVFCYSRTVLLCVVFFRLNTTWAGYTVKS